MVVELVAASAAGMTVVEVVALADVVTGSAVSVPGVVAAPELTVLYSHLQLLEDSLLELGQNLTVLVLLT